MLVIKPSPLGVKLSSSSETSPDQTYAGDPGAVILLRLEKLFLDGNRLPLLLPVVDWRAAESLVTNDDEIPLMSVCDKNVDVGGASNSTNVEKWNFGPCLDGAISDCLLKL